VTAGRNALAALAVLFGLGALVVAPVVIQAVLPDEGPLPAGDRLDVGYGVTLRPPPGARLELSGSRPGTGDVVLLAGGLRLKVTAVEVRERPADFVAHAKRKFARDEAVRPGPPEAVRTAAGVRGERGDLRPTDDPLAGEPGCYGVFSAEQVGVVASISPVAGCAEAPAEVWAAVASIEFADAADRS
jgi:hypothetical protein